MRPPVALVLIFAISACSTVRTVPPAPAEVCAQPGLWAIYVRERVDEPRRALPRPLPPGKAAAAGAWSGGAGSVKAGFELPPTYDAFLSPLVLALGIAVAPVAAIVGAGVGAASAYSEPEIAAAEESMTRALEAANTADAIRARVVTLAEQQVGRQLCDCGSVDDLDACRLQSPEPIAVVLSMTVSPPYFEIDGSITPDLTLLLSVDAEVVRASDRVVLHRRAWVYRGHQHGYFQLAADDAALFRAQLDSAARALAAKVVYDLMIGGREEVYALGEQPAGTVWTIFPGTVKLQPLFPPARVSQERD
jgi:hypothetical protein